MKGLVAAQPAASHMNFHDMPEEPLAPLVTSNAAGFETILTFPWRLDVIKAKH